MVFIVQSIIGGYSLVAERAAVARATRVRFPVAALSEPCASGSVVCGSVQGANGSPSASRCLPVAALSRRKLAPQVLPSVASLELRARMVFERIQTDRGSKAQSKRNKR